MIHLKSFTRILFCLTLLFFITATAVFAANPDESTPIRRIGYETLTAKQKTIYEQLVKGIENNEKEIYLQPSAAASDAELAMSMIYNDYPEFFWLDGGAIFWSSGKKVISLEPTCLDISDQQESMDQAIDEILSGMPSSADTDYKKALYLHDALISWAEYDWDGNAYDQSPYSALVLRSTVCAGYTRAYQLLLNKVGISSWHVGGTSGGGAHAWNQVWIGDQCVYTDVTWDDAGDYPLYDYFSLSLEQISADHTPVDEYKAGLPSCNHDLDLRPRKNVIQTVDAPITAAELAEKAFILSKNDFSYATIHFQCESFQESSLDSSFYDAFLEATNCNAIILYTYSTTEYEFVAYSGVGGTYHIVTDDILQFWLSYQSVCLPNGSYPFYVAYYAENGQMLAVNTVTGILSNGEVMLLQESPRNFAECRVFLLDPESGIPLSPIAQLIAQ